MTAQDDSNSRTNLIHECWAYNLQISDRKSALQLTLKSRFDEKSVSPCRVRAEGYVCENHQQKIKELSDDYWKYAERIGFARDPWTDSSIETDLLQIIRKREDILENSTRIYTLRNKWMCFMAANFTLDTKEDAEELTRIQNQLNRLHGLYIKVLGNFLKISAREDDKEGQKKWGDIFRNIAELDKLAKNEYETFLIWYTKRVKLCRKLLNDVYESRAKLLEELITKYYLVGKVFECGKEEYVKNTAAIYILSHIQVRRMLWPEKKANLYCDYGTYRQRGEKPGPPETRKTARPCHCLRDPHSRDMQAHDTRFNDIEVNNLWTLDKCMGMVYTCSLPPMRQHKTMLEIISDFAQGAPLKVTLRDIKMDADSVPINGLFDIINGEDIHLYLLTVAVFCGDRQVYGTTQINHTPLTPKEIQASITMFYKSHVKDIIEKVKKM